MKVSRDSRKTISQARISLDRVNVSFPVYQGGSRSVKKAFLSLSSAGRIARDAHDRITVDALRDVTLSLGNGDRLAVIGANGAGKTTLLRVMAGIYEPVAGAVDIRGHISPLLDIGVGLDMDLSGYDNIRVRGALLGQSPREVENHLPEIAEFTELGEYLNMPMRTYSSGMILRLTFAVATCFEPEILLMDEWISAGDAHFMERAQRRIETFVGKASVLVLASHNLEICRRWCKTAIWMAGGRIRASGPVEDIIRTYQTAVA